MKAHVYENLLRHAGLFLLLAAPVNLHGQAASTPVKPGLWDTQASATTKIALPPEAEAKIAALPPAQQAQVRSMMGGAGAAPTVTSRQVCIAPGSSMDSMLNRLQQSPAMQCNLANRTETATGASFDITCTMQTGNSTGSATGHVTFAKIDDDHMSSTTHMTLTGSSQGHTTNMAMDSTESAKFVSADCGDVKPYGPPAAK